MKANEDVAYLQAVFVKTAAAITASSVFYIKYKKHSVIIKFKTTQIMYTPIKVKMSVCT
jgi:hypothetical protein